ncbi:MAG: carboxypeptidase regulatory-like domain-containing protein, partial [Vulcanimicrobiota bacterium]
MKFNKISFNLLIFSIILSLFFAGCGGGGESEEVSYSTVEGIVTDASGNILEGVTVTIDGKSDLTNSTGMYTIDFVDAGPQVITATKTGYQDYSTTVDVNSGNTTVKNIQMSISTTGTIKGTVTAQAGGNLPNVTVYIKGTEISTTTGSDGSYTLSNVPDGEQVIVGTKSGYKSYSSTITVTPAQVLQKNFEMEAGSSGNVSGQVTSSLGGELENVTVLIGS